MRAGDIHAVRYGEELAPRLLLEEGERTVERRLRAVPGRWTAFYENLPRALDGSEPLLVTPESVRDALRVLVALRKSAATGDSVRP